MAEQQIQNPRFYLQFLSTLNRLLIKSNEATNAQALIFIILNDTVHLIKYEHALLYDMRASKPKLLGISGFVKVDHRSEAVERWNSLVRNLKDPYKAQVITSDSFSESGELLTEIQKNLRNQTILWIPIKNQNNLVLGLWLEGCQKEAEDVSYDDILNLTENFLAPGYASAWKRFSSNISVRSFKKPLLYLALLGSIAALFLVHVPLRIVAPAQVVPKDPYVVTAPIEGIIEDIIVTPGQEVHKGVALIEYDKKVPLQQLKTAQKQVEMIQTELDRAKTLGLKDDKALLELSLLALKLEREKINLDLTEYNTSLLTVYAPEYGIVMLDDPDDWRGKPVRVGEKILTVSDPLKSKIRIWIPEHDNILLNSKRPIKVFLNVMPEKSYRAQITFIANESTVSEKHVPSFIGEADWIGKAPDINLGVKGTAILYGDDVTLFYYIIRRPLNYFREFLGV